jgi:amidase
MTLSAPSLEDLRRAARALGLGLDDTQLAEYEMFAAAFVEMLGRLDDLPEPERAAPYTHDPGRRPKPAENPLGAWAWKCSVKGASGGPLAGKRVVLKDNIALAGVPLTNGSAGLQDYIPDFDATITMRILDAGGEIIGKATCEDLSLSAGSHTAATGPVRNPHDRTRSTGGSSSGCAALLANGESDLAVGGDQGGSIRIPSALCGVYGLKPTHGLVPYTGAFPCEPSVDHLGPMGRNAAEVALLLDVIAGDDGLDPRQRNVQGRPYREALQDDLTGLRVGMLDEGFRQPGADERVNDAVLKAAQRFDDLGALVTTVSVPWHQDGAVLSGSILSQGIASIVLTANGGGVLGRGWYPTSLIDAWGAARARPDAELPSMLPMHALVGEYLRDAYHGRYYAKAQNLAHVLTAAYDAVLREVDLLVMPTTQTIAPPLPAADASVLESVAAASSNVGNTSQFNVSGHPAMSVPCARVDDLPVGMMLVGRRWEDDVVLRAAHAFEQTTQYE